MMGNVHPMFSFRLLFFSMIELWNYFVNKWWQLSSGYERSR